MLNYYYNKKFGPILNPRTSFRNKRKKVNIEVNYKKCSGCLICSDSCPENAIYQKGDRIHIDKSYCKLCGICINSCPLKCLKIIGLKNKN